MNSRAFFFSLVAGLFILGLLQTAHRHLAFDIPLLLGETRSVWNIDAKITFDAQDNSVIASLTTVLKHMIKPDHVPCN